MAIALDKDGFELFDRIIAASSRVELVSVYDSPPPREAIESRQFVTYSDTAFLLAAPAVGRAYMVTTPHSVRDGGSSDGVAVSEDRTSVIWWSDNVYETEFQRTRLGRMKPVLNFDKERRQSPNGYRVRQVGVIVKGRATRAEASAKWFRRRRECPARTRAFGPLNPSAYLAYMPVPTVRCQVESPLPERYATRWPASCLSAAIRSPRYRRFSDAALGWLIRIGRVSVARRASPA